MRTQHKQFLGWHGVLFALGLAIAALGCKGSTSENTPGSDGGPGSPNSKDGSTTAGSGGGGKGGHGGGGAGSSGSSGNGDDGGGLPDGAADGHVGDPCKGPHSCWNCAATSDPQYLNHCTNSQCEPFDNKARLLGYDKNGKLPALP